MECVYDENIEGTFTHEQHPLVLNQIKKGNVLCILDYLINLINKRHSQLYANCHMTMPPLYWIYQQQQKG